MISPTGTASSAAGGGAEFRVVFALLGDVRINSRAIRQIRALLEIGAEVEVYCYDSPDARDPFNGRVRFHLFEAPETAGIRYFYAAHRRLRRLLHDVRADVYHASDLYCLPALASLAKKNRAALVFDSRELYPYVGYASRKPWVSLFWHLLEGRYIKRCDAVFTVNDSIADRIRQAYGIERPVVVPNVPPRVSVVPSDYLRSRTGIPEGTPLVLYQGHTKRGRGCTALVDAMDGVPDAALVFLGDGDLRPELQQRAGAGAAAARVFFLDPVPPDELLSVTAGADIGACLIEDLTLSLRFALPNKLFEYLMAGVPVLVTDLPEMASVVRQHDVGMIVDDVEPVKIASALRSMLSDQRRRTEWKRNTATVFETFNWDSTSHRFTNVYASLVR